ncbi:MAG: hypothetical protein O2814_08810 [Bacteroidetes bacterium]|nr:hypothetical protein [Bacteroidota bacterium]
MGIEQLGMVLQLLLGGHWYSHQYTLPLLMRSEYALMIPLGLRPVIGIYMDYRLESLIVKPQ